MDQEEIVSALKDHVDSLQKIVRWSLLFALAFWWAGIQQSDNIKALGIDFTRGQALFVAICTYLIINLTRLDKLWRVGDLIKLLDNSSITRGLGKLAYHSWELNPYSYFGSSLFARIHSSKGLGLLIIVWWICNSSIYSLSDNIQAPLAKILQAIFLAIGLSSIVAANRSYKIIY